MLKKIGQRLLDWLAPEPPPVLTPMPAHVRDMPINSGLLMLHLVDSARINPAVKVGFVPPARGKE